MNSLEELLAVERIRALKARYCRFLDTKQWDGLADLFLLDAVLDAATSHQVHSPEIELGGPGSATGIWAMQDRVVWQPGKSPVPGVASITGYGQYHETYRLTAAGWKFASLRLTRFHVDMHPA